MTKTFVVYFDREHISNKDKYYVKYLCKKFELINNIDSLNQFIDNNSGYSFILHCVFYDQQFNLFKNLNRNNLHKHKFYCFLDDIHTFFGDDLRKNSQLTTLFFYLDLAFKIFATYKYNLVHLGLEKYVKKTIWLPHYANPDFYLNNFETNKKNKILLSGNISEMYDFRSFLNKINNENIEVLEHAGWNLKNYDNKIIGNKYAQIINQYKCAFVDCVVPSGFEFLVHKNKNKRYAVAKIFEIGLCKTLLLVDERIVFVLEQLGFVKNKHYIGCNSYNIKSKINWIIDENNNDKINEIIDNAYELIKTKHTIIPRVKLVLKNISDNDYYEKFNYPKIFPCMNIYYSNPKLKIPNNFSCFKKLVFENELHDVIKNDVSDYVMYIQNEIDFSKINFELIDELLLFGYNIYFTKYNGKMKKVSEPPENYIFNIVNRKFIEKNKYIEI